MHHIAPQEDSGPDTEDNAAPLCPTCHEIYGANPTKRKFIREARDFWYETCANSQATGGVSSEDLRLELEGVATKNDIAELRDQLVALLSVKVPMALVSAAPVSNQDDFVPVSIDRYVQTFYEDEFCEDDRLFDFFFNSRIWYEPGSDSYEFLDARALFLRLYGERTAGRICLFECNSVGFSLDGFTEDLFGKVLRRIRTQIIMIVGHEKFRKNGFQCSVGHSGEFQWRMKPSGKTKMKMRKSDAATRSVRDLPAT